MDNYVTEGVAEYVLTLFKGFRGVCIDVGAYDPYWLNNSWIFERIGWDTYCIEPNPNCIPGLRKHRKNVLEYACGDRNKNNVKFFIWNNEIVGEAGGTGLTDFTQEKDRWKIQIVKEIKVKVRTLDWLMENEIKQDRIDYLSIDVENSEMAVLRGTDLLRWKPKVIVIENIDEDQEQRDYIIERKYRRVNRIVFNDIYIQNDYYMENIFIEGMGME